MVKTGIASIIQVTAFDELSYRFINEQRQANINEQLRCYKSAFITTSFLKEKENNQECELAGCPVIELRKVRDHSQCAADQRIIGGFQLFVFYENKQVINRHRLKCQSKTVTARKTIKVEHKRI